MGYINWNRKRPGGRRIVPGGLNDGPSEEAVQVHWLDFQSPCLLQNSQATMFSASVTKQATGESPSYKNFLKNTPSTKLSKYTMYKTSNIE